jgi:hypothetical protein
MALTIGEANEAPKFHFPNISSFVPYPARESFKPRHLIGPEDSASIVAANISDEFSDSDTVFVITI